VESNHHSKELLLYRQLSSPRARRSRVQGGRPDSNRHQRASQARMLTVTPRPPRSSRRVGGDDRARTGDLSVDNRLLFSSELRPRWSSAGGIRTHGLELMRLARTASPLPRRSARLDSNQRSPVPKTGGVAKLPYRQKSIVHTPGGSRTRCFPVESRASSPFDHGGASFGRRAAPAAGLEPALRE
jgi:hypothetical protein